MRPMKTCPICGKEFNNIHRGSHSVRAFIPTKRDNGEEVFDCQMLEWTLAVCGRCVQKHELFSLGSER